MDDGVELLRDKRGHEQLTFAEVCDHLVDFRRRSPEHAEAVNQLAGFLARVADVAHEHRVAKRSTLDPAAAREV